MRNDALMNGGLIGFGLGFIGASLALYRIVSLVVPDYASLWYFRGVIVIGAVGLVIGIILELTQRAKMKKETVKKE